MLNLFINSTTFGQTFSSIFDLAIEGKLVDKRITSFEDCVVVEPVYERTISTEKLAQLALAGDTKKISGIGKALETENIRVNSLNALIAQLNVIDSLDTKEVVIAYIPGALLQEFESGKFKFYLSGETETTYYSEEELDLWRIAIPLLSKLYARLVFKNIESCKTNKSGSAQQAERVQIYSSMYKKLLSAYKELKELKGGKASLKATGTDDSAFAE